MYPDFPQLPVAPSIKALNQHNDARGSHLKWFGLGDLEIPGFEVIEVFRTENRKDVVRGLHFQQHPDQAKILICLSGSAIVNLVCLDPGNQEFGKTVRTEVTAAEPVRIYIPFRWGLGYRTTSDHTIMLYLANAPFDAAGDTGIDPFDPDLNIDWGPGITRESAILSQRDRELETFSDYRGRVYRTGVRS